ncbi:Acg family FMN-binding oxidoreductase [Anaeromyxobacter paludicola]|uniref:NAD(P)H nitroreductase n=1 Tax=Anaeromyxobacter paludicola TaxID=2918171 RepID=A0ABM7XF36_9BACT|nr:nitroreductase family protein [Anaeromyxobacter paludicola]BDG10500.1 NAD(P)H nitroreductase [Anaeromyxobacter paludicola]
MPEATDATRELVRLAGLAPSRHNAQPWAFEVEGEELRLYGDPARALPVSDPAGREQLIGCGAALANLRLAAAWQGRATSCELMGGSRHDFLLARVRLEHAARPTALAARLADAIPARRTVRLAMEQRPLPRGLVSELARIAWEEGASLRPVEPSTARAVAERVAEADRRQWASAAFRAEVARWTRPSASRSRDGIPGYARGLSGAASWLEPVRLRFARDAAAEAARDLARALGASALVALSTPEDRGADWLRAGQAMEKVLLRAAAEGLSACWLNSPLELPDLRQEVREVLGERWHPQLLFRLGADAAGTPSRPTPRRAPEELIRRLAPASPRRQELALRT